MSRNIGYVVIEYNQAGGPPTVPDGGDIHYDRADAEDDKQWRENLLKQSGRRERYVIAAVTAPEEGDDD